MIYMPERPLDPPDDEVIETDPDLAYDEHRQAEIDRAAANDTFPILAPERLLLSKIAGLLEAYATISECGLPLSESGQKTAREYADKLRELGGWI